MGRFAGPQDCKWEELTMRKVLLATCVSVLAALAAGAANASDELNKMAQNPKDWVMPTGDYANTRYSKLNQINATNVNKLQVAWTFSTGVLRGHDCLLYTSDAADDLLCVDLGGRR